MVCHDDYIDASTNSPLYLMNQGGCPGYKSGSAAPSPSQGGGDPSVSCFYSKLKHCKSYFGVSTQTTGITMLVIVCIFLIADWNNWFWNAFSQVRIPWYQSITARLSTFTKMNDLSKKEASFWGDENPSLIRDLLDILPGVIILLLGLSVMGYVIPYAFRFPLNHEMNIPPYFIFCCMLVTNMITLVTNMITNMIMLVSNMITNMIMPVTNKTTHVSARFSARWSRKRAWTGWGRSRLLLLMPIKLIRKPCHFPRFLHQNIEISNILGWIYLVPNADHSSAFFLC